MIDDTEYLTKKAVARRINELEIKGDRMIEESIKIKRGVELKLKSNEPISTYEFGNLQGKLQVLLALGFITMYEFSLWFLKIEDAWDMEQELKDGGHKSWEE